MLLGDLLLIDELQSGEGFVRAALRMRAGHRIFEGHFPGRPVLPAACLVGLIQELVASATFPGLQMAKAGPVKFIHMVEPGLDVSLRVTVSIHAADGGDWRVSAEAWHAGKVCFRFTGTFREGSGYAG